MKKISNLLIGFLGILILGMTSTIASADLLWDNADSHTWFKEDWGGATNISWVTFDGRKCLKVDALGPNYGLIKTDFFADENWEGPVTGFKADVYLATNLNGVRVKLEPKTHSGAGIEGIYSNGLTPNTWNTLTWTFTGSLDYSAIARLILVLDYLNGNSATFYVDNLRLVRGSGDENWDSMDASSHRWTISSEDGGGYDDAVDWNLNGPNDFVTHNQANNSSAGSIYLLWDANQNLDNDYAKIYPKTELNEDWSSYSGIKMDVYCSSTEANIKVGFWDGTNYVVTPTKQVALANAWQTLTWDFPPGTFNWSLVKIIEPTVETNVVSAGSLYVDNICLLSTSSAKASIWIIGKRDQSSSEFHLDGTETSYTVDYNCVLSFRGATVPVCSDPHFPGYYGEAHPPYDEEPPFPVPGFPDKISDVTKPFTINFDLDAADANRDAILTLATTPDAGQSAMHIDIVVNGTNVGTVYLDTSAGKIVAQQTIPATTLVNGANTLVLSKQERGATRIWDYIDLSTNYTQTDLYEALASDAAEKAYDTSPPPGTTPYWDPLHPISIYTYSLIESLWDKAFLRADKDYGWMAFQRPSGQMQIWPIDLYKYDVSNEYHLFPYDIDDWDWSEIEAWDRDDHNAKWADADPSNDPVGPYLEHIGIPENRRRHTQLEIADKNPPWSWIHTVHGNGFVKLQAPGADHSASIRSFFANSFSLAPAPEGNEDQSRFFEGYVKVLDSENLQITTKIGGNYFDGVMQWKFSTPQTTEMGRYSKMEIKEKVFARRDFDVSTDSGRVAFAGVASMFWKDEDDTIYNSTDQAHDSDLVMIQKADGSFITHELGQFPAEWAQTYDANNPPPNYNDPAPYIFNLGPVGAGDIVYILQQDRNRDHYTTYVGPEYWKRASLIFTILESSKNLVLKVYEGVPWVEWWDGSVVVFEIDPTEADINIGDMLSIKYEVASVVLPGVFITSPNGGELNKFESSTYDIKWEAHDAMEPDVSIAGITLQYSSDGLNWTDIASNEANDGIYSWDISAVPLGSYWLKIIGTNSKGQIGWDVSDEKIEIKEGFVPRPNILTNPSFETGDVSGWSAWAVDVNSSVVTSPVHLGTYALREVLNNGEANGGYLQNLITLGMSPGDSLYGSVWIKAESLTNEEAYLRIEFMDDNWAQTGPPLESNHITGTSDWTKVSVSGAIPPGTTKANFILKLSSTGAVSGNVYFDEVNAGVNAAVQSTVTYLAPDHYDANGIPVYYIGTTMGYELHINNVVSEDLNNLTIQAIQEYHESGVGYNKGDALPGDSSQTWFNQAIPQGGELALTDTYYIPTDAHPGLDQTHVIVSRNGVELYNEDEAGIWCPPPLISGKIMIQGRTDQSGQITFELRKPGQAKAAYTFQVSPDASGKYTLYNSTSTPIPEGTYDLAAKGATSLRAVKKGIQVIHDKVASNGDFNLLGGDANGDNSIGTGDMVTLKNAWLTKAGDQKWDKRADFNNDGSVGTEDMAIMKSNWLKKGEN